MTNLREKIVPRFITLIAERLSLNADQLSAVSNHRTFRSGAIYRAMNCAATMCALGNEGFSCLN
ncbi:hypothetical protein [Pantoea leporis]|jgi:hypothetical protein|uniref:hypothetical protein n=1 Tax=Pantoea leporis TaxID=2933780 RepID=UPI002302F8D0|nr:hypothetical protein [Pantoea leporis]